MICKDRADTIDWGPALTGLSDAWPEVIEPFGHSASQIAGVDNAVSLLKSFLTLEPVFGDTPRQALTDQIQTYQAILLSQSPAAAILGLTSAA